MLVLVFSAGLRKFFKAHNIFYMRLSS